jgi:hypothetical protein
MVLKIFLNVIKINRKIKKLKEDIYKKQYHLLI